VSVSSLALLGPVDLFSFLFSAAIAPQHFLSFYGDFGLLIQTNFASSNSLLT
jgi:hypothetical protein